MNSSFLKICNTAVFRLSSEEGAVDYLSAFEKLFLTLASVKKYTEVDNEVIKLDFQSFYGLHLNSLFVSEFINRLQANGFITKNKVDKKRYFDRENIINLNLESDLQSIKDDVKVFINEFSIFLKKQDQQFNDEEVESFLYRSIQDTIFSLSLKDYGGDFTLNSNEKFLFDLFIKEISLNNPALINTYKKIMYGQVYTAVIAQNDITTNKLFVYKGLNVFLDSGFVFNALGLNYYSDKSEYLELLNSLKQMGAHLYIFEHTFTEMKDIIENAINWIDNVNFDQFHASKTATYFVLSKTSKSEAFDILYGFQDNLSKLGISVFNELNIDYSDVEGVDITNLQTEIEGEYKKRGIYDPDKYIAYNNDAKSIFFTHKLRKGRIERKFSDVDYIFITSNSFLSKLAIDFNDKKFRGAKNVPCVLRDSLLSTLVWFESNNYSENNNALFLIPSLYHAFEPSLALLEKMNQVFIALRERGEMSDNAIHDWKTDVAYQKCILTITKNDPDKFDEETPGQILKSYKREISSILIPFVDEAKLKKQKLVKKINALKVVLFISLILIFIGVFVALYFFLYWFVSLFIDFEYAAIIFEGIIIALTTILSFVDIKGKRFAKVVFDTIDLKVFNFRNYKALEIVEKQIKDADKAVEQ